MQFSSWVSVLGSSAGDYSIESYYKHKILVLVIVNMLGLLLLLLLLLVVVFVNNFFTEVPNLITLNLSVVSSTLRIVVMSVITDFKKYLIHSL
jgi:hypothetical protein